MSSPKVSAVGAVGNKVVFKLHGRLYETGALSAASASTLTVAQAEALIALGQATPEQMNYLDQFPWTNPPK